MFVKLSGSILLLYILFSFSGSKIYSAVFDNGDKKQDDKVKSQVTTEYEYVNGTPISSGTKSRVTNFDSFGNKIEEINYKPTGEVHSVALYKYDEKGNKISYSKYTGNKEKLEYSQTSAYDKDGKKISETGFNGAENFKTDYIYNNGKLSEIIYNIDGKIDERRVFSYSGSEVDIKVLNPKGQTQYILRNTYNAGGKILTEEKLENNNVSRKVSYDYDSKGNLIQEEKFLNGKFNSRISRVYNTNGWLMEIYQENNGMGKFITHQYKYDKNGTVVSELYRNSPDKEFSKDIYKFNDKGINVSIDSYYASYNQQVLYKFNYEYY